MRTLASLVVLWSAACSLDRGVLSVDASRDARTDAGADATPPMDATSPRDASDDRPMDALADVDSARPSCDEIYGSAQEYLFCESDARSCSFSVRLASVDSCTDVCARYGGSCLASYFNAIDDLCTSVGNDTCDAIRGNNICVCSGP